MAFNDVLALRTPLSTPIAGAIPGDPLLQLLRLSLAREIAIEVGPTAVTMQGAVTNIKLPLLLPDAFVFKMPNMPKRAFGVAPLLPAIEHCLGSVSSDAYKVEQRGVTVVLGEDASFFSTNNATMRHAKVDGGYGAGRIVLPAAFCKELVRLAKGKSARIAFARDHAMARIGETYLFTHLIGVEHPIDYERALTKHRPRTAMGPVPRNLKLVIERAVIAANGGDTQITTSRGKITLHTRSALVEVTDVVKVGQAQPDVVTKLDCKHLKDVEGFDRWLITKECVVMSPSCRPS